MDIQLTPRSLAYIFFKRSRVVVWFLTFCIVLTCAYIFATPWQYESSARLLVKINFDNPELARPDFGSNPAAGGRSQSPQISDDVIKSMVVSYKAMATSQDIERTTLEKMQVQRVYPKLAPPLLGGTVMDKAIEKLDGDLDVQQLKDSDIIQISLLNHDPHIAQETVATLLSEFIALQQSVFRSPSTSFVERQFEVARRNSQSEDATLSEFKVAHQLSSLADERTQLLQKHTDVFDSLSGARAELSAALARKEALRTSMLDFGSNATVSSGTDAMSRQLDEAQGRLSAQIERADAARVSYPADSPFVKNADTAVADARARLQDIQREIRETVRGGASPVYQALQTDFLRNDAEVSASRAKVATIETDIRTISARLLEIDRLEGQLHQLETRVEVAQDNLSTQLQRVEESRISTDLNNSQITSLSVVQQPTLGFKIARPRWKLMIFLALFFGIFGGLAAGLVLESMDETFGLPEQLEAAVGVPVLATLNFLPR